MSCWLNSMRCLGRIRDFAHVRVPALQSRCTLANLCVTLAHAKGILLSGTFTPTPEAAKLSAAPHFNNSSTPVIVRFSNATAFPTIPDTDPNTESRGMAIRFTLGDHVHTDIVNQSSPLIPSADRRRASRVIESIGSISA